MDNVTPLPDRKTMESDASAWIAQLDGTKPSQEDLAALREWMNRSPEHRAAIERLSALWDDLNILTQLAVPLPGRSEEERRGVLNRFFRSAAGAPAAAAIAAAATLVVVAGIWQWYRTDTPAAVAEGPETIQVVRVQRGIYTTTVGEQERINLADGSRILLNTDSEVAIYLGATYRNIRLLKGEALFEVARDPKRPFQVHAGGGLVRAVGTTFAVYLKETDNVSVTVTEGVVELAAVFGPEPGRPTTHTEAPPAPLATIKAGQCATFGRSIESIQSLAQAEIERQLSWRNGMLRFEGEPLSQVVLEVSRYTNTRIVILDPGVRDLRIGGYFKVGEIESMFEALESSFGVHVERTNENLVHLSAARP